MVLVIVSQSVFYTSVLDAGHARAQQFKAVPDEPLNDTDIEKSIEQLKSNDAKLIHLNLNNIKVRSAGQSMFSVYYTNWFVWPYL